MFAFFMVHRSGLDECELVYHVVERHAVCVLVVKETACSKVLPTHLLK